VLSGSAPNRSSYVSAILPEALSSLASVLIRADEVRDPQNNTLLHEITKIGVSVTGDARDSAVTVAVMLLRAGLKWEMENNATPPQNVLTYAGISDTHAFVVQVNRAYLEQGSKLQRELGAFLLDYQNKLIATVAWKERWKSKFFTRLIIAFLEWRGSYTDEQLDQRARVTKEFLALLREARAIYDDSRVRDRLRGIASGAEAFPRGAFGHSSFVDFAAELVVALGDWLEMGATPAFRSLREGTETEFLRVALANVGVEETLDDDDEKAAMAKELETEKERADAKTREAEVEKKRADAAEKRAADVELENADLQRQLRELKAGKVADEGAAGAGAPPPQVKPVIGADAQPA
jgi:hypothetical protein